MKYTLAICALLLSVHASPLDYPTESQQEEVYYPAPEQQTGYDIANNVTIQVQLNETTTAADYSTPVEVYATTTADYSAPTTQDYPVSDAYVPSATTTADYAATPVLYTTQETPYIAPPVQTNTTAECDDVACAERFIQKYQTSSSEPTYSIQTTAAY
ncbi:hypothetical protein O9G_000865 [Rozella allomycis CSF55]|uniref:Uncharacterized protein n=1 Tax=Rozella allomycis (strain CSF55) TaxID=988480 RepID=A0A075ARI5_ROZAC|nr:hypothetical protein O9G_000865 [Rozella allomycis CSF55]|eukprot:EPZ32790.1 hypothetical protein O9G_000865 [Rozella allomycis CSF55]